MLRLLFASQMYHKNNRWAKSEVFSSIPHYKRISKRAAKHQHQTNKSRDGAKPKKKNFIFVLSMSALNEQKHSMVL